MSTINRCDICGKDENNRGINISKEPIKLQIVNYKKEPYNIFVRINIEPDTDTQKYDSLINKMKNIRCEKDAMDLYKECTEGKNSNYTIDKGNIYIKLNNPEPHICDKCKRGLAELVLKYGKYEVLTKF